MFAKILDRRTRRYEDYGNYENFGFFMVGALQMDFKM